jgi:hypothetical protein
MMYAMPLTTETAMNVPAAKSQISVFVILSMGASRWPQPGNLNPQAWESSEPVKRLQTISLALGKLPGAVFTFRRPVAALFLLFGLQVGCLDQPHRQFASLFLRLQLCNEARAQPALRDGAQVLPFRQTA